MQKPARKQGRNTQVGCYALAYARASAPWLLRKPLKDQTRVGPAKTKIIRQHIIDVSIARRIWNVIQVTIRIGSLVVDRRRQFVLLQNLYREHRFNSTGCAESMTRHRFGRAYGNVISVLAENLFDRQRLKFIVIRRRSAVSVNVADLLGEKLGVFERTLHNADRTRTGFVRHRYMKRIAAHPITDDLGKNVGAARLREFKPFEYQYARAFADDETVTFKIEWP